MFLKETSMNMERLEKKMQNQRKLLLFFKLKAHGIFFIFLKNIISSNI